MLLSFSNIFDLIRLANKHTVDSKRHLKIMDENRLVLKPRQSQDKNTDLCETEIKTHQVLEGSTSFKVVIATIQKKKF